MKTNCFQWFWIPVSFVCQTGNFWSFVSFELGVLDCKRFVTSRVDIMSALMMSLWMTIKCLRCKCQAQSWEIIEEGRMNYRTMYETVDSRRTVFAGKEFQFPFGVNEFWQTRVEFSANNDRKIVWEVFFALHSIRWSFEDNSKWPVPSAHTLYTPKLTKRKKYNLFMWKEIRERDRQRKQVYWIVSRPKYESIQHNWFDWSHIIIACSFVFSSWGEVFARPGLIDLHELNSS